MKLKSLNEFDEIGTERSSVINFGTQSFQFFWQMNVLEELDGFFFKYSGIEDDIAKNYLDEIHLILEKQSSLAQVFESIINSTKLSDEFQFSAKYALDEHFNYEVVSYQSDLVCRCFGVAKRGLLEDLNKGETVRFDQWKEKYMVAMGCGTCEAFANEFFQNAIDLPKQPSVELKKLRRSKVIDDKYLVKPLGKTPVQVREFLQETSPLKSLEIKEVHGYRILLGTTHQDDIEKLTNYYIENHRVQFEFELG